MTILKIFLTLIFWSVWIYVIFTVPYPDSITQADSSQLLSFFIPLFLALTATVNLLLKNLPSSIILSLGLILLLILKALQSINTISVILTLAAITLLISYFKGFENLTPIKSGLTSSLNMPKLTRWRKRHSSSHT